jgi:hypothetical protein
VGPGQVSAVPVDGTVLLDLIFRFTAAAISDPIWSPPSATRVIAGGAANHRAAAQRSKAPEAAGRDGGVGGGSGSGGALAGCTAPTRSRISARVAPGKY